jgi:hypothetical protein
MRSRYVQRKLKKEEEEEGKVVPNVQIQVWGAWDQPSK